MENLPWFKFYGPEYLSDPKMLNLSACERSCWITLLAYASQNNGYVKHLDEFKLMIQAGVNRMEDEWEQTEGVLKHFENLGMIEVSNDLITIVNWGKRQERAMTPYERVKKFRSKNSDNAEITDETERNADDNDRVEKIREDKKRNTCMCFEEKIWPIFPKKVAKKKAEQAMKKVPHSEHENIAIDIRRKVPSRQWQESGGQYIPHLATYLNQERWKDQIDVPKPAPPKKVCRICKTSEATGWVQQGGNICGKCWEESQRSPGKKALEHMKAKSPIKTI